MAVICDEIFPVPWTLEYFIYLFKHEKEIFELQKRHHSNSINLTNKISFWTIIFLVHQDHANPEENEFSECLEWNMDLKEQ